MSRQQQPVFPHRRLRRLLIGTYCGTLTNNRAQALDVYDRVIPGAPCWEVLGGVHSDGYIGGTAMGKALISGRPAGKSVAEEKA